MISHTDLNSVLAKTTTFIRPVIWGKGVYLVLHHKSRANRLAGTQNTLNKHLLFECCKDDGWVTCFLSDKTSDLWGENILKFSSRQTWNHTTLAAGCSRRLNGTERFESWVLPCLIGGNLQCVCHWWVMVCVPLLVWTRPVTPNFGTFADCCADQIRTMHSSSNSQVMEPA